MIIRHLWIKNFGKFHNREIDLKEGINLVYGKNESGKSTLHTFIQGIFFGIRKMRGRASKNDVYTRFEPWENEGYYAGSIRFSCGGRNFRLDRNFRKDNQKTELICEDDGEKLSVEDGDLGVLLGNVSQVVYDNTVSIGQLKSQTSDGIIAELRNYMSNYQSDTDGQVDIEKAIHSLKEKKKVFEQQKKQEEQKRQGLLSQISMRIQYLDEEKKELDAKIAEAEARARELERGTKDSVPPAPRESTGEKGRFPGVLWGLAVLFMAFLFVLPGIWGKAAGAGAFLILLLLYLWRKPRKGTSFQQEASGMGTTGEPGLEEKIQWTLEHLRGERRERETAGENLWEEYRELSFSVQNDLLPVQEEIDSIELAISTIQDLARRMQSQVGLRLKRQTSEILSELTNGRYTQLSISEEFQIHLNTDRNYIPLEQLSRGTVEQVYFALRMAVGDILCREEPLPVLLDEPFAMYDDQRLESALRWLGEHKQQVVLFTCQDRERRLLDEMGVGYYWVEV